MMIHQLAKHYGCPQGVMAHIAHRHPALLATIEELGPMRIHWNREWGWMLDNMPVQVVRGRGGVMEWRITPSNRNGGQLDGGWPHAG